jgi:signal transduction histidine kinase
MSRREAVEGGAFLVVGLVERVLLGQLSLWALLAPVLVAAGVALRRSVPTGAILVALAITVAGFGGVEHNEAVLPLAAVIFVSYSSGAYGEAWRSALALAVGLGSIWVQLARESPTVMDLVLPGLGLGGPWAAGLVVRRLRVSEERLRERTADLETAQSEVARLSVAAERRRIARELHDVLAHGVTMMVVQAGAAEQLLATDRERAGEAMVQIQEAGRQVVKDLGRLLGFLRTDDDGDDLLGPVPGIEDIAALAHDLGIVGTRVAANIRGDARHLSAGLGVAVYRIVQEAVTNAVKHGAFEVNIDVEPRLASVVVDVVSRGRGRANAVGGSGRGLLGIRERAAFYGGDVTIRDNGDSFQLRAELHDAAIQP